MRKASKVLLLVGAILSIAMAVSAFVGMIVMFALGSDASKQLLIDMINNGQVKTDLQGTPEEIATLLQMTYNGIGAALTVSTVFAILNSIFAFRARGAEKPSKALSILNIVFGILSGVEVNAVGGIFALVADEIENNNNNNNNHEEVVEAEIKE